VISIRWIATHKKPGPRKMAHTIASFSRGPAHDLVIRGHFTLQFAPGQGFTNLLAFKNKRPHTMRSYRLAELADRAYASGELALAEVLIDAAYAAATEHFERQQISETELH
jgi:hypothetical protein